MDIFTGIVILVIVIALSGSQGEPRGRTYLAPEEDGDTPLNFPTSDMEMDIGDNDGEPK